MSIKFDRIAHRLAITAESRIPVLSSESLSIDVLGAYGPYHTRIIVARKKIKCVRQVRLLILLNTFLVVIMGSPLFSFAVSNLVYLF